MGLARKCNYTADGTTSNMNMNGLPSHTIPELTLYHHLPGWRRNYNPTRGTDRCYSPGWGEGECSPGSRVSPEGIFHIIASSACSIQCNDISEVAPYASTSTPANLPPPPLLLSLSGTGQVGRVKLIESCVRFI